jgi:hypothetical protein
LKLRNCKNILGRSSSLDAQLICTDMRRLRQRCRTYATSVLNERIIANALSDALDRDKGTTIDSVWITGHPEAITDCAVGSEKCRSYETAVERRIGLPHSDVPAHTGGPDL